MGKFNELLAARYNDGPSAVLGLSEQEGIRTVAPELMGVFTVEDARPEHSFNKGEKRWFAGGSEALQALNFTQVAVINPVGSNVLTVITRAIISDTTAAGVIVAGLSTNLAAANGFPTNASPSARDTRWSNLGNFNCATVVRSSAALVARIGSINQQIVALANVGVEMIKDAVVLSPGTAYVVSSGVVNQTLVYSFEGYERGILPEENAA